MENMRMKKLMLFAIAAGCAAVGAAPVSLLEFDGSFEKTPLGAATKFVHWYFYTPVERIKTAIVADAPAELPVRRALHVDYTQAVKADNSRSFYSEFLPIDPKKSYRQSVWLKTGGKSERGYGVNLGRHFYDRNKKLIAYPDHHAKSLMFRNQGPEKWTKFEAILTPALIPGKVSAGEIPPEAAFVRIYFNSYGYNRTYTITGHELKLAVPETADPAVAADGCIAYPVCGKGVPEIDGVLDEALWQTPGDRWSGNFRRTICKPEFSVEKPAGETFFKIWKNQDKAVVAVRCLSTAPEKIISAPHPANDGKIFAEETVELHLDITGSRRFIWQLTVNPDGSWAQYLNKAPRKFPVKTAVKRHDKGWNAEIEIPLRELWVAVNDAGGAPSELFWNFNCARTQPGAAEKEQFSAWNPSGFYFYNPEAMGVLLFDRPEKVLKKVVERAAEFAGKIPWEKLQLQMDNPTLKKELANIQQASAIPQAYLQELSGKKVSLTAAGFAGSFAFFCNYGSFMDGLCRKYRAHNFRFPAEKAAAGCFFTKVPLCDPVVESAIVDSAQAADFFTVTAAGNECVPLRLRIFAGSDLESIRFNCTALKNERGGEIPAEAVDIRILTPWGSDHQADILATDMRIPLQGFLKNYARAERFIPRIKSGEAQDIILLIKVHKGAKSGKYRGKLSFLPGNKKPTELGIDVDVLPFDLPEAEKSVGFYSHSVIFDPKAPAIGTPGAKFYNGMESEKSFAESMKLLHDHGFNFVIQVAYRNGPLDPDYCGKLLELMYHSGIRRTALMGAEHLISPAAIEAGNEKLLEERKTILRQRVGKIVQQAAKYPFEKFYIYGFDEPNDDNGAKRNNMIFEICRESGVPGIVSCIFEDVRRKIKNMDTVVMNYHSMTSSNHNLLHRSENGLKRMYYCNLTGGFDTAVRMNFGWYLERSGFDGSAPWALYYLAQYWDPFRDFHASKEDYANNGCYIFITADQPIPTLKFLSAAAGVADLRYIQKFKSLLADCADKEKKAALQKRFDRLVEIFELRNELHNQSRNFKHPAALYDKLRGDLQQLIKELL